MSGSSQTIESFDFAVDATFLVTVFLEALEALEALDAEALEVLVGSVDFILDFLLGFLGLFKATKSANACAIYSVS